MRIEAVQYITHILYFFETCLLLIYFFDLFVQPNYLLFSFLVVGEIGFSEIYKFIIFAIKFITSIFQLRQTLIYFMLFDLKITNL